jgi:hypothetical protein
MNATMLLLAAMLMIITASAMHSLWPHAAHDIEMRRAIPPQYPSAHVRRPHSVMSLGPRFHVKERKLEVTNEAFPDYSEVAETVTQFKPGRFIDAMKLSLVKEMIKSDMEKDLEKDIKYIFGLVSALSPYDERALQDIKAWRGSERSQKKVDLKYVNAMAYFLSEVQIFAQHISWALRKALMDSVRKFYTLELMSPIVESMAKTICEKTSIRDMVHFSKKAKIRGKEKLADKIVKDVKDDPKVVAELLDNISENMATLGFYIVGHFFIYSLPRDLRPKVLARIQAVFLNDDPRLVYGVGDFNFQRQGDKFVFDADKLQLKETIWLPKEHYSRIKTIMKDISKTLASVSIEILSLGIASLMITLGGIFGGMLKVMHRLPLVHDFVNALLEIKIRSEIMKDK